MAILCFFQFSEPYWSKTKTGTGVSVTQVKNLGLVLLSVWIWDGLSRSLRSYTLVNLAKNTISKKWKKYPKFQDLISERVLKIQTHNFGVFHSSDRWTSMIFFKIFWGGDLGHFSKSGWFDMEWPYMYVINPNRFLEFSWYFFFKKKNLCMGNQT